MGIDLGARRSVVAIIEGSRPAIIASVEGPRATPSDVAFTTGDQRLVGGTARRQAILHPGRTVSSAKRFIGRRLDEVTREIEGLPVDVVAGPDDAVRFEIGGESHAPEEVSAAVIRKLVDDASTYLGERVTGVVVTVPAHFDDAQRRATIDAGRIAGVEVRGIIAEPTAAALAYRVEKKRNETVLVYDFGGGSFDVSILDIGDGIVEVRATCGDGHLGGDDLDRTIVDLLADDFEREHGVDLRRDRQALQRLSIAAEMAKIELSAASRTSIDLPFVAVDASGSKHLHHTLARETFEGLIADLLERTAASVARALADARLSATDIDEVILVGGTTRIPAVRELVRRLSGGRDPNMTVNPDEVVAMGAAIQAAILEGEMTDLMLLDVTPVSLGVETDGGEMTRLIERNTTIPARRSQVFTTAEDEQGAVDIVILKGERERSGENRRLACLRLEGIRRAPMGVPRIEVTFDVNADGVLDVTAVDRDTGAELGVTISGTPTLDRTELDRMVAEAGTRGSGSVDAPTEDATTEDRG